MGAKSTFPLFEIVLGFLSNLLMSYAAVLSSNPSRLEHVRDEWEMIVASAIISLV